MSVEGTFCLLPPEDIRTPMKLWFVIDHSNSMSPNAKNGNPGNDPNSERFDRSVALVTALAGSGLEIQFGGQVFAGRENNEIENRTRVFTDPRFVSDPAAFAAGIVEAIGNQPNQTTSGGTPVKAALDLAFTELNFDILEAEAAGTARGSRYMVIFISDGQPTDSTAGTILETVYVDFMQNLAPRVGELTFNTVFLGSTQDDAAAAEELMLQMAQLGGGTFLSFENGDALSYEGLDFTPLRRVYERRFFLLGNRNALPEGTRHVADSDADGLSDAREIELATDPALRDTDADGCGDRLESARGWDPLAPGGSAECDCAPETRASDLDGDGLTDCEESLLLSNPLQPDSDLGAGNATVGDLIPDGLDETYLHGLLLPNDSRDEDGDTTGDLAELRRHTDPRTIEDPESVARWAYRYADLTPAEEEGCFAFHVENVSLLPATATAGHGADENVLELFVAQSPQDDPLLRRFFFARTAVELSREGGIVEVDAAAFEEVSPAAP